MNSSPTPATPLHEVWERPFVKDHARWCGDFVLELRMRDVPGAVIGERLAEVEGHCAETGEAPSVAFGDPSQYAARIDDNSAPQRTSGVWTVTAAGSTQVLAMLVGTSAVTAWARGDALTYNLGQVLCLAATLLVLLSLPLMLRPMTRHPWTIGAPLVAVVVLGAGGAALSARSDLATIAELPAPVIAIALFVVVLALAWVEYRELTRDTDGDLVTSPLPAVPEQANATTSRRRWTTLAPVCLVPAAYLVFAASNWLSA